MEKIIPEYTFRTKGDIEQLKKDFEKVSVKVAVTGLVLLVGPIMFAGVWEIFFLVNPIDKLLSQKYGMLIYIICGLILLKTLTWTRISKEHARLHRMVRIVKKYEEMLKKLEKALKENDHALVREILDDLGNAEELFGRMEDYQQAVIKAKEFLSLK